jgi:hypothetical protein
LYNRWVGKERERERVDRQGQGERDTERLRERKRAGESRRDKDKFRIVFSGLRKSRKVKHKEVCIIDLALNLRRRWRRLQKETSDKHLIQLLKQFWHVDNFVGVNFA